MAWDELDEARRTRRWSTRALGVGRVSMAGTLPLGGPGVAAAERETVRLHAAGGLRGARPEVARDVTASHGVPVDRVFGASGLLRGRLERGEPGDVFAAADMEHPQALAQR